LSLFKPLRASEFPLPLKEILIGVSRVGRVFPFFISFILFQFPRHPEVLQAYLTVFLLFFLVFAFWFLLKEGLLKYLSRDHRGMSAGLRIVYLLTLSVMFLGSLELLRLRVSDGAFFLVLFLMAPIGLASLFRDRKQYSLYILSLLVFYSGVTYLSLYFSIGVWQLQPIMLSLAMACAIVAVDMSEVLKEILASSPSDSKSKKSSKQSRATERQAPNFSLKVKKSYIRTYSLLLFAPPAFMSLLYAFGIFPAIILLTLWSVPFALELSNQMEKTIKTGQDCPPMLAYTTRIYLFSFLFTLVLASLL